MTAIPERDVPPPSAEAPFVPVEERYRLLVEAVNEYAIFMLAPSGCVATWNRGAQRIKGYAPDEIVGQHFSIFYPPEDVAAGKPERELQTALSTGQVEDEGWRVRKNGSRFWANVTITAVRDAAGTLCGFTKVTRDMTERVRLRELEQADQVSARIQQAREDEQRRIARELHDDLGQQLTALRWDIAMLATRLREPAADPRAIADETEALTSQVDSTIGSLRRIASNLRPPVLDDLGLAAALDWLKQDFTRRFSVAADLEFDDRDVAFGDFASTTIFRMVQEGLTNVARHAQAQHVAVSLVCAGDTCHVRIDDDGHGASLTPSGKLRSLGLLGIRERARQLGGIALFDSAPGRGFHISINLPLEGNRASDRD